MHHLVCIFHLDFGQEIFFVHEWKGAPPSSPFIIIVILLSLRDREKQNTLYLLLPFVSPPTIPGPLGAALQKWCRKKAKGDKLPDGGVWGKRERNLRDGLGSPPDNLNQRKELGLCQQAQPNTTSAFWPSNSQELVGDFFQRHPHPTPRGAVCPREMEAWEGREKKERAKLFFVVVIIVGRYFIFQM